MSVCASCQQELPVGARWCPLCRANTINQTVGTLAAPGSRFAAHLLDLAIFAMVPVAFWMSASAAGDSGLMALLVLAVGAAFLVWALALFARGRTPGKKLMSLRVIREDGDHAGFWRMLFREWIGKWISTFILSLGFLWILFDKENQGWHDKFASTYVVKNQ